MADSEGEPTKRGEENNNWDEGVEEHRSRYAWTSVFLLEMVEFERLTVITVMTAKRRKQKYLPKELVNNGIHILSAFLWSAVCFI